ncbi:MAG: FAD-dependent oxidoreductase [Planctomycetaceae bacterium]|nr:FAD-dependent oxidoreductase [Planctomycetaceae bacterium]
MSKKFSRRLFLETGAATWAALACGVSSGQSNPSNQPVGKSVVFQEDHVDVLVVGGGTAGIMAALQAARAGVKTMLVERSSQLGGTITNGGLSSPGMFNAWGKQIIAGIGWDLVKRTIETDGGNLPDFSEPYKNNHGHFQPPINPFVFTLLAEDDCIKAGVEIRYYEFPLGVEPTENGWRVAVVGAGVRRTILCRQLIDCTGGGDVVALAGFHRLREEETQPGAILYKFGSAFNPGRERLPGLGTYVPGADSSNSITRTRDNILGRQTVLQKLRSEKSKNSASARLFLLQPESAVRESWRIDSEYVITGDDYTTGRKFDDAICYAFFPVDIHRVQKKATLENLKEGIIPTVPLRALVPKGGKNILAAGRCVGSDRIANSGLRVQAPCMAMGQAAGAAAALAAKKNGHPLTVPFKELRQLLEEHGAIVPD